MTDTRTDDAGEPRVALLVDVVSSRSATRPALHQAILEAAAEANRHPALTDPLRPTVGDELQGVYTSVGGALAASYILRLSLAPRWDVRFGVGGGAVHVIDRERGIQDGSAWWHAREAIDWVKALARRKGHASARTAIRDGRSVAIPQADALARLVDAQLARLRPGALSTLRGMWQGLDNAEIAEREGITASANSQRVIGNDLRPLLEAMTALCTLP